jgi:hypothetical protein
VLACAALALCLGLHVDFALAASKQRPVRRRAAPAQSAAAKQKINRPRRAAGRGAATPIPASGERRVQVRVVEVAGGRAYLAPGGGEHVRVGDQIRIGGRRYPVLSVNEKNAVIGLGSQRLERGQRGSVTVRVTEAKSFETRGAPRPLRAFAGQWRPPQLPAESQSPRFVALGVMTIPGAIEPL